MGTSHQEVGTLSLRESFLEVHSMFSTAGAPGRTLLKIRLSRTDMKTLTTKDLCGPCPGTPSLSPGHGPRDMNTTLSENRERDWKAIGQKTTTQTWAEHGPPPTLRLRQPRMTRVHRWRSRLYADVTGPGAPCKQLAASRAASEMALRGIRGFRSLEHSKEQHPGVVDK